MGDTISQAQALSTHMSLYFAFSLIFLVSLLLAARSMKDFEIPAEIRKLLHSRRMKGTIDFRKDKIVHYSSASSSPDGSR